MRLGAIHCPTPAEVSHLAGVARLDLMTPPASCDWTENCPADGDALRNDMLGNCVEVAACRAIQYRRANAWRDQWKPTGGQASALYVAWAGYDGTPATDNGTDTVKAMSAWCSTGIVASDQVLDVPQWAAVDPFHAAAVSLAIAHLGPVQVTLNLPAAWQGRFDLWDVPAAGVSGAEGKPGGWGQHRVCAPRYDADGTRWVLSWGLLIPITPAAWDAYVLGVDATVAWDWLDATGLAPSGLTREALAVDLTRVANG
jgi:hypothetical protein